MSRIPRLSLECAACLGMLRLGHRCRGLLYSSRAEQGQLPAFWLEPGCHDQLSVLKALLPSPPFPCEPPTSCPRHCSGCSSDLGTPTKLGISPDLRPSFPVREKDQTGDWRPISEGPRSWTVGLFDLVCQSPWLAARWLSPLVDLPGDLGSLGHWALICKMDDRVWSKLHAHQRPRVSQYSRRETQGSGEMVP